MSPLGAVGYVARVVPGSGLLVSQTSFWRPRARPASPPRPVRVRGQRSGGQWGETRNLHRAVSSCVSTAGKSVLRCRAFSAVDTRRVPRPVPSHACLGTGPAVAL